MSDLNKQYFETKEKHKQGRKAAGKLTLKKGIRNIVWSFILITITSVLLKKCEQRIDQNKKNGKTISKPEIIKTQKNYQFFDLNVELQQIKNKSSCTSKLIVYKENKLVDSILFRPEGVGGEYGIREPHRLKNYLLFTKHGDYDGRTLLINKKGEIINIIGGENYHDKANQILISIYESDINGLAVYDLKNDKVLLEIEQIDCYPISVHKTEDSYFLKGQDYESDDISIWEIEIDSKKMVQTKVKVNDLNDKNKLDYLIGEEAYCICK